MANEDFPDSDDDMTDDDMIEELFIRHSNFTDDQLRAEVSRLVKQHGDPERAFEAVEQRVSSAVNATLDRIGSEARTYGILVAARDELAEQAEGLDDSEEDAPESGEQESD